MAEEATDTLKIYWDHFFKAETGTYEKSTWLDLFLAEFLIRVNDGANPKELIKFCPVSGVVTLVGCELLCGIHRVTSSINTHYSVPLPCLETPCSGKTTPLNADAANGTLGVDIKPEEAKVQSTSLFTRTYAQSSEEILRKYILGGVAWKCLVLLKALGVEGLSCCRQLSSVLIWLFGELSGAAAPAAPAAAAPAPPAPPAPSADTRTPIHLLFSHKIWSKQKPGGAPGSKVNSAASSERGSVTGRSRHFNQMKLDASDIKTKRKSIKHSDQSSESGDSNDDLLILNRSLTIKVCTPNDDFEYFNSSIRSSNEYPNESLYSDPYYSPRKAKAKADDYMNDKHREIINSDISTFEFTLIITDLLQQLCKAESSLSGSEGSQISVQCINFSLRNLCSLQFSSLPAQSIQNNAQEVSRIKVALTELLIVSLDQVLIHSDLCAKLINSGILPMLLRILEDVISKSSNRYTKNDYHNRNKVFQIDKTESENLLKFVFGIAYSITAFFHCLLMQCRSIDKLREFTDQFRLYGECLKGGLLKDCIELMIRIPGDEEETVTLIKKLIDTIGKIVNGMKRVRSEVVHSAACPRSKHKVCRQRVAAGMHHHHDILGEASTGLPMSSACCISVLYATLTSLLTDEEVSAQTVLRNKILRVMLNCGVCCCFCPGFLMESIVRLMLTHNSVASLCHQVLEHTVYGELGASVLIQKVTDQLPCSICEPCDEREKRDTNKKYCQHGVSPIDRKSVFSFLIHYNSLLQLDNHNNVLHATVSHLLRVTPKCRIEMKYELLFSVIYPTFIVAKHRYIIRLEESARFLTVACLNIFASLLNTVSFAEQFIQKGGLSYVLELVSLSEFSNQCCSILEIAIIVEIFKLMKENSELTYFREMGSLASVQMLFKSLATMTDKCYKIYKLKLPEEKFQELCDVAIERESLAFIPASDVRKSTSPKTMRTFVNTTMTEDTIEDHIGILNNIWTFWKTCAGLCLYSPMFREYVVSESVFLDSYALLKVLLYYLCNCECGMAEMRVLIKIIEALLTVQFAVSDVTSGRSKETSGSLVRSALGGPAAGLAGGGAGGGGGLRALCEALIRVATTTPSHRHTMPRLAHPKVPPLLCPSGSSSAEYSSSEDSAAGPYASEHSEPAAASLAAPALARPDDGYEADVEITCKMETSTPYKTRKISGNMSTISSPLTGLQSPPPEIMNMECPEYIKNGELAHPELCIIVVDILTQLIHKLVTSKRTEGQNEGRIQRVGGQLARACCARLSGALSRAGAGAGLAPPLLLRRLLAPTPAELLASTDQQLEDLQRSILELIHVLASQSIEPPELGSFLKLFTAERPPLTMLLTALTRLFAAAEHNTPDCILTFPIERYSADGVQSLSEELNYMVVHNTTTSQSHQAENAARKMQEAHLRAGIKSIWSVGAVRCGVEGAGWAPWLSGFALLLWIRPHHAHTHTHTHGHHRRHNTRDSGEEFLEECTTDSSTKSPKKEGAPSRPSELSHVLSVGHDSLMFELWLDTNTGTFTVRLSRPEVGCNRVHSEARIGPGPGPGPASGPGLLPHQHWTCVAINVREMVRKRQIYIQVTLFINGYECETVSLPVQGILVRKVTPTSMVVGQVGGGGGVYHLSHAALYRAPVLSAATALHLTAHGPDHACQVRCESPNYPLVLTPNVLDSNIDWDQVYEISRATLRELHDNLLLTFSAQAPNIMNLYHQTVALPTVFSGRVPSTASLIASAAVSGAGAGVGAGGGGAGAGGGGATIPEALFPTWSGAALPSRHRGLAPALYMLGGPDHLLYLYARVVELEGTAVEQATALGVLLRACRVDNRLYAMFYGDDMPDMLLTVFASPKCRVTHHLLKVILESACSGPLLSVCGETVQVCVRSDSVVLEPALLVLLTRAWRHLDNHHARWEGDGGEDEVGAGSSAGVGVGMGCGSMWTLWLCCLRVLLRDSHPRRAFNHYQMNRLNLMDHLLLACKERFLNSECGPLDPAASNNLVEVVRGLMGSPPLLCRLALLCDFLLLMHQASDTFVTHSRANFYFLLTSETQDMSEFNASATKRRNSKRVKKKTQPRSSASSTSTDDVTNENSLNVLKEMAQNQDGDTDKMESSVESMKQMKGIINMQIKEGRKHNVSSTSDNSDTPIVDERVVNGEASGEAVAGDAEDKLNEYIVVEEDDVNHTTVEMYTGGIYHQRRVRAGAEPGWSACEGLLLLLRDTLAVLPDHELAQAVSGGVATERLVVVGNHRSGGVRAALVRLVAALQRRATTDLARRWTHQYYYVHLANQISLYEGSWELAAACATLLTKCDVPLEDQLDEEIWMDVGSEWAPRAAPLVALLPACVRDVPLAHHLVLLLTKLIDKASLKVLSELCVAEVVVRAIRAVGSTVLEDGRELLLDDLYDLLNRLAIKALTSQHSMQTITELHHMLTYIELSAESSQDDTSASVVQVAHDAQLSLYNVQLDYLEERLNTSYTASTKTTNYFATVLTSAAGAVGAVGGAGAGGEGGRVERAELAARHASTAARAVSFLLTHKPRDPIEPDGLLLDRLLATLTLAVSGSSPQRPKWWAPAGGEWAGTLQELFWWSARPEPAARALQPRLLRALYTAPPHALNALAPQDPPTMRKLAVYLLTIVQHIHAVAETGPAPVELAITDWARSWALATQAGLPDRLHSDSLALEADALLRHDRDRWARAANKIRTAVAKVLFSKEAMAHKVTETAMCVTRQVVDVQNAHRKCFMDHLRTAHARHLAIAARWQALITDYTHEQGVWHEPKSYPCSWQLDATEGAARVRVRLTRAHLRIHPRFLKPNCRHKAETVNYPSPLRSVVGGWWTLRGGLVARLQLNETVSYMARVTYVTVASEQGGELLLSDRCIHFVPEDCESEESQGQGQGQGTRKEKAFVPLQSAAQSWSLEGVVQVSTRRWCLQERAVELFLSSGHAHLLAFTDVTERTAFLKALAASHLPGKIEPDTLTDAMNQWRNGTITNWEYLMRLNGLAGRTYNDLMQYPVLPFIIADYTSRILDLNDPASFRDLSKPMAVQNKNREQHYINTYNDLKAARREGCSPLVARQPHHYASLYSNSGGVLHYLVRLPPFTELFLNYQDNNFDMPDRTFHSLATTWRLITNDSPTDVKELIPELFYLPELFHNNEGLNLGKRQCGAGVDSVELPAWAADARLFTLIHRQALEAPHVTERLPHWIDLVFGYKQTGQPALDAINVFPACTYYGFDPSALEDEVDRTAAAAMVRTYGQAPRQLLRAPHPHRTHDLTQHHHAHEQVSVWAGVRGAWWGRYCGSPGAGAGAVCVAGRRACGAGGLHALPHPRSVAAAPRAARLLHLHHDHGEASSPGNQANGQAGSLALVSWGHSDNMVRLKRRRDVRPDLLLHVPALDQITKVTTCISGGCPYSLFVGHWSGRVVCVRARGPARGARTRSLHAHRAPLADLHACPRAALLATASVDGTIVLWDLNKLTYIRTLPNRDMLPVTHVTVSETLCDVAAVHEVTSPVTSRAAPTPDRTDADQDMDAYEKDAYKYKSLIRVHTVNATYVGSVKVSERVTCICYSNAAEGVSVNVVAAGLETGGVRLYSSWDLRALLYIPTPDLHAPLVSITYSSDSQLLFGCYGEGTVVAWESGTQGRSQPVRILPAHALF